MVTNITIPPAALDAGTDTIRDYRKAGVTSDKIARAAFLAMIEAWPGMAHYRGGWEPVIHNYCKPHLILPLPPAEASDE